MDGADIAVVSDKRVVESAVNVVTSRVKGKNVGEKISKPEYSLTLTSLSAMDTDKTKIAENIITQSHDIVSGVKAKIGGETFIFENGKNDIVDKYLSKYDVDSVSCKSEFLEDVSLESGLFLTSDVNKDTDIDSVLGTVPVQTVATLVTEKNIDFKTVTVPTSNLVKGTNQVKCEGVAGTSRVVEEVIYLNGTETERKTVSEDVISQPVDKVILVGTSITPAEAQYKAAAHNSGFIFPLSGSYRLGSPFGDGRKHKGYDILTDYGMPIYASKAGTVIRSAWYGGYGNCVDIDHGNGYVTRYGHASQLLCKVGQKVNAGDIIAKIGSTGNSTGNHVHFEVIINGKRVDPAPFLNID